MNFIPELKDIHAYRYILMNSWEADRNGKPREWDHIWNLTEEVWRWLQAEIGKSNTRPAGFDSTASDWNGGTIAGFDWEPGGQGQPLQISLLARLIRNSGFLQSGMRRLGPASLKDLQTLWNQLRTFQEDKDAVTKSGNTFHDEDVYCLFARTTPGNNLPLQSRSMLKALLPEPVDEIFVCQFSWGCVAIPGHSQSPVLVLQVTGSEGQEDASWFINDILPQVAVLTHNIIRESNAYSITKSRVLDRVNKLAKVLSGPEAKLLRADLNHSAGAPKKKSARILSRLESRIETVSTAVDSLLEELGRLKKKLISMDAAISQIELKLDHPVLVNERDVLRRIYRDSSAMLIEELRRDYKLFQAHNQEARVSLQTLQAMVGVEQAKQERRMVLIIGIVGLVLAVVDGFADVLSWECRALIVATGMIAAILIWFHNPKRKLQNQHY